MDYAVINENGIVQNIVFAQPQQAQKHQNWIPYGNLLIQIDQCWYDFDTSHFYRLDGNPILTFDEYIFFQQAINKTLTGDTNEN